MQTPTTASTESTAFALESYEDETLPAGERLLTEEDLVGHTIKAVIIHPMGRLSDQADVVIVTNTLCWLVLQAEDSYSCDERSSITVRGRTYGVDLSETLFDYLGASDMFRHGLVTDAQRDALLDIEAAKEQEQNKKKADALRAQLAYLERGAV